MKPLTIKLYNKKEGEYQTYTQDFIPLRKTIEYLEQEADLYKKSNGYVPQKDIMDLQVKFVAGLFESKEVTEKAIYDGLDIRNQGVIGNIISEYVLGILPEEAVDEKKEQEI